MTRREHFICTIQRDEDSRITGIAVWSRDLGEVERDTRVNGNRAPQLAAALREILHTAGIPARQWSSSRPIELDEVTGAHVELLLLAVEPLRRYDRLLAVAEGIAAMSREEATYWHAKSRRPHGLPALRLLLAGDGGRT